MSYVRPINTRMAALENEIRRHQPRVCVFVPGHEIHVFVYGAWSAGPDLYLVVGRDWKTALSVFINEVRPASEEDARVLATWRARMALA